MNRDFWKEKKIMAIHEEPPVPVFETLEPVYGGGSHLEEAQLRFDNLKSKFLKIFGHHPQLFARSPGPSPSLSHQSEKNDPRSYN